MSYCGTLKNIQLENYLQKNVSAAILKFTIAASVNQSDQPSKVVMYDLDKKQRPRNYF